MHWLSTTWDVLRETLLLGWAATALFCAIACAAAAAWGGVSRIVAAVAGAVTLYLGLAVVSALAASRANTRRTAVLTTPPAPSAGPLTYETFPGEPATGVRGAWRNWTRTPPRRVDVVLAAVAVACAIAWAATLATGWLRVRAIDRKVVALGAFEVQLGLFVVLTVLALLGCAAGMLRWRSAWWPALLAWFGTWWALVFVLVRRAAGDRLEQLSRLLRDQARDRLGYDVRPEIDLGPVWPAVGVLAAATMLLAVALVATHPRPVAAARGPVGGGTMPAWPTPRP
ncbi:hypothetical protein [Jatrophihabitans fulvus]